MSTAETSRSRSPASRSNANDYVSMAKDKLRELCAAACIPESHGEAHAFRVLDHAEQALATCDPPGLSTSRALAVKLAALLHDADDKKYFSSTPKGSYPNASTIMRDCGVDEQVVQRALRMIDLVSCSKNGNSCPEDAKKEPDLLWPRWADRLEATGKIGVVRCWQYNQEKGSECTACGGVPKPSCFLCAGTGRQGAAPLYCADTPKPENEKEMWELATPDRFQQYQTSKGVSKSMMDHYYDKLLRVACPPFEIVKNRYLEEEMKKGAQPLVDICMTFSQTGQVPVRDILQMESQFTNMGA